MTERHWHIHISSKERHRSYYTNNYDQVLTLIGQTDPNDFERLVIQVPVMPGKHSHNSKLWINLDGVEDETSDSADDNGGDTSAVDGS